MTMSGFSLSKLCKQRIPILNWLPRYKVADGIGDLVAGFTVGLTLIPQAIAYAGLAGLSPEYGLYSAFAGSFIYIVFGTCREVNIGPTALISLLTFTYARGVPEYAALLCFLSGCVTVILGVLRMGFLVEFVSIPVVSGFTSAASLIIACSQIKGLLGLKIHGESFIDIFVQLAKNISDTRIPDLMLSFCCIVFLLVLKSLKDIKIPNDTLKKVMWFLSTSRNALIVLLSATVSYIYEMNQNGAPFVLTGHIDAGLPKPELPKFSMTVDNRTETFLDICKNFGSGILIVPLISIIGNVAIAKAFSQGRALDATQELLTLGLCNVVGAFFHSMPVTGSFSRSAVNNASGVKTPMGGIYTGILVLFALSLLTPYFYYIPRATLSSVIISAVIFMVEVNILQPIWNCSKRDLIPAFTTFFACLFAGVELGIVVGVAVDLAILIYYNARPTIYIEYRNTTTANYVLVRPSSGLMFPAVEYLRTYLTETLSQKRPISVQNRVNFECVVLDCGYIDRIDFTAARVLTSVIADIKKNNHTFILLRSSDEHLKSLEALSKEPILTAKSDSDIIAILREINSIKETEQLENSKIIDLNAKTLDKTSLSTKL